MNYSLREEDVIEYMGSISDWNGDDIEKLANFLSLNVCIVTHDSAIIVKNDETPYYYCIVHTSYYLKSREGYHW